MSPETPRRRIGMVGLLLVLAVVLAAYFGWQLREQSGRVDAAADAEAAGVAAATNMLTYDFSTIDEDFAWVQDDGTKKFQQSFAGAADDAKQLAVATEARSEAEVRGSGVHLTDEDHATVLVAIDSVLTEPDKAAAENQRWRIELTMVRQDGRWLVDELELL